MASRRTHRGSRDFRYAPSTMMHPPLLFQPIFREKVWGGRRLADRLGKSLPEGVRIGESWELADLPDSIPDGRSTIANGPWRGRTLREVLHEQREWLMGSAELTEEGGFPLLIKYLDARENLSVQVHPDADYVRAHPEAHLKSEAWVVIDAEPGAVIYKGLKPGVTEADLRAHAGTPAIREDLVAVPAVPGACHYLPSGTVHALGAGVLVAEVQTPSDTTFRIDDWGRTGRELHLEEAIECIRFGVDGGDAGEPSPPPIEVGSTRTFELVRTPYFGLERIELRSAGVLEIVTSGMPEVWMILSGSGGIEVAGEPMNAMERGQTWLIPASLTGASARSGTGLEFLRVSLPSPVEGALA
ncbi:MAG: mannose-6-phosphate isomerase [Phycisphaerales bacterium]|nr:MAG: mannose-6-phosphate isomerase [Phycisphaerales bacterium]